MKCAGGIYKQKYCLKISGTFDESSEYEMLLTDLSDNRFLTFSLDTIEKQGILNLKSSSSECYAYIDLSDSGVTILGEEEDEAFYPYLDYFLYAQHCITEVWYQNSLTSILLEVFRRGLLFFCF